MALLFKKKSNNVLFPIRLAQYFLTPIHPSPPSLPAEMVLECSEGSCSKAIGVFCPNSNRVT